MDDTATKSGPLIRIQMMTHQLATCHPTNGMDKITTVQVFEPVLIGIMGVGLTVEFVGRGVFNPILVTSVLREYISTCGTTGTRDLLDTPPH